MKASSRFLVVLQTSGLSLAAGSSWGQPARALPVHAIRTRDNHAVRAPNLSTVANNAAILNSIWLKNEADTAFVQKDANGDMGFLYSVRYTFKENMPDGVYRLFVNDTITTESTFRKGKEEGMRKRYAFGSLMDELPYHLGEINGYAREYNWQDTHKLLSVTYYHDGEPYIVTQFSPTGDIIGRLYYANRDGSGSPYWREAKVPGWTNPAGLTQNGESVTSSRPRNGLYELDSIFGKYQLQFKNDLLEWWKWFDGYGKLMVEVHARPGQQL